MAMPCIARARPTCARLRGTEACIAPRLDGAGRAPLQRSDHHPSGRFVQSFRPGESVQRLFSAVMKCDAALGGSGQSRRGRPSSRDFQVPSRSSAQVATNCPSDILHLHTADLALRSIYWQRPIATERKRQRGNSALARLNRDDDLFDKPVIVSRLSRGPVRAIPRLLKLVKNQKNTDAPK